MNGTNRLATVLLAVLAITLVSADTDVETTLSSVSQCPDDPSSASVLIRHESNCEKYYMCAFGQKILMQCGLRDTNRNSLYFDEAAQGCVWPENSTCVSSLKSVHSEEVVESNSEAPNTSEGSSDTTEAEPTIPTECPATNEGNAIHITHESDCGLFYKCDHGKKVLHSCPSGLSFHPVHQVCDWPENVGCVPGGSDSDSDSDADSDVSSSSTPAAGETEEESSSSAESSITTQVPSNSEEADSNSSEGSISDTTEAESTIPTECPATNEGDATHIAHESDCGLFYKCDHGNKVLQECPSGLAFNAVDQVCDWPQNVDCVPSSSDSDSGSESDSNSLSSSVSTSEETKEDSKEIGDESKEDESNENESKEEDSTDGDDNGTSESGSPTEIESSSAESDTTAQAPSNSVETDSESVEGSGSDTTEAESAIPTECPPTNEGNATHIAHESDCGLFYKCDHGNKILFNCPSGLAFNPVYEVCDWAHNVGCTPGSSNEASSTDSDDSDSSTHSAITEESEDSTTEVASEVSSEENDSTSTTEAIVPTECPATNDGSVTHIAHESNCGFFYKCDHGKKVLFECSDGLAFNPTLQVCDWPNNVGCTPSSSDDTTNADDDVPSSSTPEVVLSW